MTVKISKQEAFLRDAAVSLGVSLEDLAKRMGAPWSTFERWLHSPNANDYKELKTEGWELVREFLADKAARGNAEAQASEQS
jgi:hypothetical protein